MNCTPRPVVYRTQTNSIAGDEMSDGKKLKKEIASLSDFERKLVLNLIAEGRTLREALRTIQESSRPPRLGPSEIKEA
jgi:pyrimidine operon attenuation protein/uracil phosphoribosyltransferase